MENVLLTTTLYIVVFGILCQFVKTKPAKTANATTATPAIKAVSPVIATTTEPVVIKPPVAPKMPVEPSIKATKPTISALIKDQVNAPIAIINSQSLAAIMEDRDVISPVKASIIATTPTVPIKQSRKKKTKKSIGGFIKEMEALV
jgi:hypothetical protein